MTYCNRGNINLDAAVAAYSSGVPVIVYSTEKQVLHGRETLEAIVQLGTPLSCAIFEDISVDDWNNSDWPEVLEAARVVCMKQGGFDPRWIDRIQ